MKTTPSELEVITRKGKPVSVIVPIKDYEALLEHVEDLDDAAWLKRLRRKPLNYRPIEEYLAERKRKRLRIAYCLNTLRNKLLTDFQPTFLSELFP